jgi:hypothetical protein
MYERQPITYRHPEEEKAIEMVSLIASLGIFGLYLYVLVCSHTPAVRDACGNDLWNTMIANIFIELALIAIVWCLVPCGAAGMGCASVTCFTAMLIVFSLLIHFATQALNIPACNTAMSNATAIKAPMLAILGLVSAGIMGVYLLLMVFTVCVGLAFAFKIQ